MRRPRQRLEATTSIRNAVAVEALEDPSLLILDGQPIPEPIVGSGPFVMNTREEIRQAFEDYQKGRMGRISTKK